MSLKAFRAFGVVTLLLNGFLSRAPHKRRIIRANVFFTSLLLLTIASTGQAQSNGSVICDLKRATESQFPHWKMNFGYGAKEFLLAEWSYEGAVVSLEGYRNFDGPAAAQKRLDQLSEVISSLMIEAGVEFSTTKVAGLADDNQLWTGHNEESTIIRLREKDLLLEVEASSVSAAVDFARFIISQMRNPTSACRGVPDEALITLPLVPASHLCNVQMSFTVMNSPLEMIRHARHDHSPRKQ